MSEISSRPIPMLVSITETQLLPLSDDCLPDPTENNASLITVSGIVSLNYTCDIEIPVEVPLSEVHALQYFTTEAKDTLEIYFVYTYSGTLSGDYNSYNVVVAADPSNVNLSEIKNVFSLIENDDPKTSRGTVTTVRSATSS